VTENDWLAERFEEHRARLLAVAYRMLGSLAEADDAVQEAWLRCSRAGAGGIENIGGWLTTVVSRVCLDMLRSRKARREEPLGTDLASPAAGAWRAAGPEQEALLADSVGLALLVVLDRLPPAERVAFVLHDMFDLPFDQIAAIMERSPNAARLLASRARRRVRGIGPGSGPGQDVAATALSGRTPSATGVHPHHDLPPHRDQRDLVSAFFAASRAGDFDALLTLLDPDVEVRADAAAVPAGVPRQTRGAAAVARQAAAFAKDAMSAQPLLVNGSVGAVVSQPWRQRAVMTFSTAGGKITGIGIIADQASLSRLELSELAG
jgi:RNA polymerase sigma-70 factor (ECF subfamily)